jgi:uncharacterized membrane protein YbhN (UPF0104 family)
MNEADNGESPIDSQMAAPPPAYRSQAPPLPQTSSAKSTTAEFIQNRFAVLGVLFLVTGFLGLPLLWMNKKFSNTERIVWSIVVIIYTCALIAFVGWIIWWAYRRIFP